ncbi:protein-export membrane protein SecD [Sporolactobacillus inulinus]|uniref:Protein translocase subunit SecD n=1 Tax=Sporolactobacillus inulinus TaxID=2078 RepID=A0A4Y1ZJ43_9BACL|nr:protein-export membrane protein SecD [Sporolactobacillus inulinus]
MVKKGPIFSFFALLIVLGIIIAFSVKPIIHNVNLGLDLKGGFEVLYQVKPLKSGQKIDSEAMSNAVASINKRINVLGVSEPNISIENGNRIRVQLPGVKNEQRARELLSTTAKLEFRDYKDRLMMDGSDLVPGKAKVAFDDMNKPKVTLQLKDPSKFASVTKKITSYYPNNMLVIWMDYQKGDSYEKEAAKNKHKFISAPSVSQELNTADVEISGNFTVQEANDLKDLLNSGSLPVRLVETYSTSVGAQFGQDSMKETIYAGAIAVAAIMLFMLLFYRLGGLIASLTLVIYMAVVMGVFVGMQAVLTLPGIAAMILGIGMAVDANIITLERIKDELRGGKTVLSAFKAGNKRSLPTVVDANLTTIIAAAVLFILGVSAVKGFAVMLLISNVVTFVTSVYGARILLGLLVHSHTLDNHPWLFGVKRSDIRGSK